jgi:hypothetical protein
VICRQQVDGVHRHLPRLIGHLRADLIPVAWVPLTVDLARWGRYPDQVGKRWLQDYYRTVTAAKPTGPSPTPVTGSAAAGNDESELS